MMPKSFALLLCALLLAGPSLAQKLAIAAAADLKFAMDDIVSAFKADQPNSEVNVSYGSSGKFQTQIQQGAPYDLYFSADSALAHDLVRSGFAASPVKAYALGRLVLWSASQDATQMTLASLTATRITRIAIANPKHAPYGQRAEQALRASGLWDQVKHKLVYGENIAQTAQFVQTGNAQVGIIALALAVHPELARQGGYWLLPRTLHTPLEQGFIVTRRAADNSLAQRFADFMATAPARAVLLRYGFELPGDSASR